MNIRATRIYPPALIKKPLLCASIMVTFAITLGGCATTAQQNNIESGPTMAQSYQAAMRASNDGSLNFIRAQVTSKNGQHSMSSAQDKLSAITTKHAVSESQKINGEFPTLPNHNIVVYIYPHLAGADQMPVQGYYTAVPFYSHIHYAIPGEMGDLI